MTPSLQTSKLSMFSHFFLSFFSFTSPCLLLVILLSLSLINFVNRLDHAIERRGEREGRYSFVVMNALFVYNDMYIFPMLCLWNSKGERRRGVRGGEGERVRGTG